MSFWQNFLAAIGGTAALILALGWLLRELGKHYLDKDLETFKNDLSSAASANIEQLKHRLQIAQLEHEVRFSNLHVKRAEVISKTYELLTDCYAASQRFTSVASWGGDPPREKKYDEAVQTARVFYEHFDRNRIWLPEDASELLEEFFRSIRQNVEGFGIYFSYKEEKLPHAVVLQKHEAWANASEAFNTELPKARRILESELRRILGDNAENTTTVPSDLDHPIQAHANDGPAA